jgi:hypothetical protein
MMMLSQLTLCSIDRVMNGDLDTVCHFCGTEESPKGPQLQRHLTQMVEVLLLIFTVAD